MKSIDVLNHFLTRAPWVNPAHTVDRVITGDPDLEVDRCAVTWMAGIREIEACAQRGIRLLICHEPTFWNHENDRPDHNPHAQAKDARIRELGITIIRNHDCWDLWPDIGIPYAWAAFLGLGTRPVALSASRYEHRYDVAPLTLGAFARGVAERCATVGEPAVQVVGDPGHIVSKIGIGTGCGCDPYRYEEMGCDCFVVCDDGSCYWREIQRARDSGFAVVRVNHGTSEEPGMVTMTDYINRNIPGLHAEHIPHGSMFTLT